MPGLSRTVDYAPGKSVDVHVPEGATGAPVVLLWHGSGPDERDALAPLAGELATRGVLAVVPDWQSDDAAAGADQLLASIAFARDGSGAFGGDPGRVVVAGWSLGANAAAWVGLHPEAFGGWTPTAVVGLGGSYTGSPFGDVFAGAGAGAGRRAVLVHGTADHLVPVEHSAEAAERLVRLRWTARLRRVGTDHAGVIGTVYDRNRRRCVPTEDPVRVEVRTRVADLVAATARRP
ncbi:MAG TPA: hypothetical protein VND44_12960 [Acidimicrobiales bacterium]|nr:hypothetical protein [Acidimicrobiales bacterium]